MASSFAIRSSGCGCGSLWPAGKVQQVAVNRCDRHRSEGAAVLRVGDSVLCDVAFGLGPTVQDRVTTISLTSPEDPKGERSAVASVPWSEVKGRRVVASLRGGFWAYAFQIRPVARRTVRT